MSADAPDYSWPDDLPPGCPPASASPADGLFYRFVKNDPPTMEDFQRPRDLPRKKPIPLEELCQYSALSLFGSPEDVQVARQYIPGFGKKRVALGELSYNMGVTHNSPQQLTPELVLESHTDWWIPTTYTECPEFRVVSL